MSRPVVLLILDGWGVAPPNRGNAISLAQTPVFDELVCTYPTMLLQASGEAVGLPWGEMGNSEVGHMNIGAGKILYQNLPRITRAITDGSFFANPAFLRATAHAQAQHSALHLAGMLSSGGIHSFHEHLYALLELCRQQGVPRVFLHLFLDGRDTPYNSAKNFVTKLQAETAKVQLGTIASMAGRSWAMDRDHHWDRTEQVYRMMTEGKAEHNTEDPVQALEASYKERVYDEEFPPTVMTDADGKPVAKVNDHDAVIFFNFRNDRMRQITQAFVEPSFAGFSRPQQRKDVFVVTMTEYAAGLPVTVAFPPEYVERPLARLLSEQGLRQLHIAETEKYAHVTFFLNGGREAPFPNEERVLIPSPSVPSYDQRPEMSAGLVTERVAGTLQNGNADFIAVNFANADMVGHTGNLPAIVKAVETLDRCIGEIVRAALAKNGMVIITADHGNAEEAMNLQTGAINKEHSANPVPLILVASEWQGKGLPEGQALSTLTPMGFLADVAPTILAMMGIAQPDEMTGRSLVRFLFPGT